MSAPAPTAAPRAIGGWWRVLGGYLHAASRFRAALAAAMLLVLIAYFAIRLPDKYLQFENFKSVLEGESTLLVLAIGVTLVLMIGEFDLSFASTIGLAGAVAVLGLTDLGLPTGLAMGLALAAGAAVGLINGLIVAYGRAPAFIATLAVGSAVAGIEGQLTNEKTISDGIPLSYLNFTLKPIVGLAASTWIALAVVGVFAVLIAWSTYGRRVRATGMNPTAATLAGLSVGKIRLSTFIVMGVLAALAGIVLSSQGGSYFPDSGAGLLLAPYSAAFLGAAVIGRGSFSPLATVFGVAFIALLERGLTMLNQSASVIGLIEGLVLALALVVAGLERRSR